jgi:hypothetical protein
MGVLVTPPEQLVIVNAPLGLQPLPPVGGEKPEYYLDFSPPLGGPSVKKQPGGLF